MGFMRFAAAVALLSAGVSTAQAANWMYVTNGGTGDFYIDTSSATQTGTVWTFWVKAVAKPAKVPPKVKSQISRWVLNCQTSTIQVLSVAQYGANGNVLYSQDNPYAPTDSIVPDSVADGFKGFVCTAGQPKP